MKMSLLGNISCDAKVWPWEEDVGNEDLIIIHASKACISYILELEM